jgi:hypothetical protein
MKQMQYYYARDARNQTSGIEFHIYDTICGSPVGVYATEDPKEIELLDGLAEKQHWRFERISLAQYEAALKKKPLPFKNLNDSKPLPPPMVTALKGQGAVVVENPEPPEPPVEIKKSVETVEEALQVAQVQPAPAVEPVVEDKKRHQKRK